LGVNTLRYCHRLNNEKECAQGIHDLLKGGGVCVVIDMNDRFPVFRARLRSFLTKRKDSEYLPSPDEYARLFASTGFEIRGKEHSTWIPHCGEDT
jgi:hypothetical protein